jgi:hypothetical protein
MAEDRIKVEIKVDWVEIGQDDEHDRDRGPDIGQYE